jgi:hypothetical protein
MQSKLNRWSNRAPQQIQHTAGTQHINKYRIKENAGLFLPLPNRPQIRFQSEGTALLYSTFLGGNSNSGAFNLTRFAIALDLFGNAYVTGYTGGASNFPTTPGAFQTMAGGSFAAFVSKLNPTGSRLIYSTYLGGSGFDTGGDIAIDITGAVYATGQTGSPKLGPRRVDIASMYNTERYRPNYDHKIGLPIFLTRP